MRPGEHVRSKDPVDRRATCSSVGTNRTEYGHPLSCASIYPVLWGLCLGGSSTMRRRRPIKEVTAQLYTYRLQNSFFSRKVEDGENDDHGA